MVLVSPRICPLTTDRAELAHGARVAKQNAVEQAPFDVGQGHAQESLKARCAKRDRRFLFFSPLIDHQRDQFARDKGKRHDIVASTIPGSAKMILMS